MIMKDNMPGYQTASHHCQWQWPSAVTFTHAQEHASLDYDTVVPLRMPSLIAQL